MYLNRIPCKNCILIVIFALDCKLFDPLINKVSKTYNLTSLSILISDIISVYNIKEYEDNEIKRTLREQLIHANI